MARYRKLMELFPAVLTCTTEDGRVYKVMKQKAHVRDFDNFLRTFKRYSEEYGER